ncbi:MAG: LysE family translocator [Chloroflexi bacterium]|nr:LysE family translocator [Chloroflexota bacterium]
MSSQRIHLWEGKLIDPTNFSLFVAASWALIIAPGPDMLYVITRGMSQGRKAGLLSALGVTLGILVHTVFAAMGLAMLLQTSALAFLAVKYIGALYLIYLGLKALKDKSSFALLKPQAVNFRSIFWQGVLSNVLNPKVALFFLAFLPQFVNQNSGNVTLQMFALGFMFAFFGIIFLSVVAYFSGGIGSWLASRTRFASALRWLTGGVFIGLGVRLAFVERR